MSKQAPVLFVTEYESRIDRQFQRQGGKLLKTCRNKDPKGKDKVKIFVGGTGKAQKRPSRNADIPFMNSGRTSVELQLEASFAGDPVDWEDLESMEIDDIQTIADTAALALGREMDDQIINEVTTNAALSEGDGAQACSVRMIMNATEKAVLANWPEEDGQWYCLLGPNAWGHLKTYKQFANADYIGDEDLPWSKKMRSSTRELDGIRYIRMNGLQSPAANQEYGLLYYGPNVAAAGRPGKTDIAWASGQKQRWEIMDKLRSGAKLVQTAGAIRLHYATNIAYQDVYHTPA